MGVFLPEFTMEASGPGMVYEVETRIFPTCSPTYHGSIEKTGASFFLYSFFRLDQKLIVLEPRLMVRWNRNRAPR